MPKPKPPKSKTKPAQKVAKKPATDAKTAKRGVSLAHVRKVAGTKPIPDYLKVNEDF